MVRQPDVDGGVWLQIFGPVRAWRGGVELGLGGPKQRTVLAVLLVNAGEPVSYATVIDAVWPQGPPPSAVNIVHTCVKRLRRVMEPHRESGAPSRLLRRVPGGYLVGATEHELDLVRYRRLIDRAGQARERGDVDRAAELLGAAVRPWQGPPLADLELLVRLHPWVASLEQERLGAALGYADVELAAGRAAGMVPWLEHLAGSAPLHEPLYARLMEAYARSGRRADALKAFERIRAVLRDDLGVGPSIELRAAHARVLRGDRRAVTALGDGAPDRLGQRRA